MNDFTKEELAEIHRCLKYMTKGGVTPYSTFTIDVMVKTQSIINNYCEHKNKCTHGAILVCEDCGKEW